MLRMNITVVLAAVLLFPASLAQAETVLGVPIETENLRLVWTEEFNEETVAIVRQQAELLFSRTVSFVRDEVKERPVIVFRGEAATGPGPDRDYPFVDSQGVVSLFRFTDDVENYFHAFVHELVHALRIERIDAADWFFEEGFAEFVRLRVYDSMDGFPWFGFPVSVVAAGHLAEGSAIPLDVLRTEHARLNLRCRAQAYALRASFFDWLGNKYGEEKVLKMSQEPIAGELEQYETYFGSPFKALVEQWAREMITHHDPMMYKQYLTTTPIRYIPLCSQEDGF